MCALLKALYRDVPIYQKHEGSITKVYGYPKFYFFLYMYTSCG